MGNIICANFYADNVTYIKISNKLTLSINYFLILITWMINKNDLLIQLSFFNIVWLPFWSVFKTILSHLIIRYRYLYFFLCIHHKWACQRDRTGNKIFCKTNIFWYMPGSQYVAYVCANYRFEIISNAKKTKRRVLYFKISHWPLK